MAADFLTGRTRLDVLGYIEKRGSCPDPAACLLALHSDSQQSRAIRAAPAASHHLAELRYEDAVAHPKKTTGYP